MRHHHVWITAGLLMAGGVAPAAHSVPSRPRFQPPSPIPILAPLSTPAETTWFGGTHWDASDQRWEANPGGVWTFDSGVGSIVPPGSSVPGKPPGYHALMEGWEGKDLYLNAELTSGAKFQRRQRSEFAGDPATCVGVDAPPLQGDWSLWAGLTQAEAQALCWPGGQGYGNNWDVSQTRSFGYGGGVVQLDFDYVLDAEPGFDYALVEIRWPSALDPIELWRLSGPNSGHVTLTLSPGTELPLPAEPVTITLRMTTDGAYSDEDGAYPTTCGGFAIDSIALTGGISHSANFETGTDGWVGGAGAPLINDFSDLRAVASLPAVPGCNLGDSVLTFARLPTWPHHPCTQDNVALSPWIDLEEAGIPAPLGVLLDTGGYFHLPLTDLIGMRFGALYYPDFCPMGGGPVESGFGSEVVYRNFSVPTCSAVTGLFRQNLSAYVPASARRLRVGLGVFNGRDALPGGCTPGGNSSPWFDNVRVGIIHSATSGVGPGFAEPKPVGITAVVPNPWTGPGLLRIDYRHPAGPGGAVTVEVLDLAGRLVRRLDASPTDPSGATLTWDGRDAMGVLVPGGIYFLHVPGSIQGSIRKVVVAR